MTSTSDVRLVDRVQASSAPDLQLQPATGKCRVLYLHDRQSDPHFLFHTPLGSADPESANQYNTHFKLDGSKFWLWQQIPVAGVFGRPAYLLKRTIVYETAELRNISVGEAPRNGNAFHITMEVEGPPQQSFDTSTAPPDIVEKLGIDTTKFPLYTKSQSQEWRSIRLVTEARSHLKNFSITKATSLLHGNMCYHPSIDQHTWVQNQHKAIASEAEFTQKTLQRFTDVQAHCVRETNWILVKIRFSTPDAARGIDEQFVLNNLAQRYKIEAPAESVLSSDVAQGYPTRTGTTWGFTGAVVSYDKHTDCVVQLRLLQYIPLDELLVFHDKVIFGINLVPIAFDKTSEESNMAHSQLAKGFDIEETRNLVSLLSDAPQSASGLSARRIFLAGELPLIENVYDDGTQWEGRLKHPDMLRQRAELVCWNRLDHWQKEAIKISDQYPLALIHGPPGTGKTSTVVTYIVARLT